MTDDPRTPFNLRLLPKQDLRLDARGVRVGQSLGAARGLESLASGGRTFHLGEPTLGGTQRARAMDPRGIDTRSASALRAPPTYAQTARELSGRRVETSFGRANPANVTSEDLRDSDKAFTDRQVVADIRAIAKRFGVAPALLATQLTAEYNFAKVSHLSKGMKLQAWRDEDGPSTLAMGLDDWVRDRARIERIVPAARAIGPGKLERDPGYAESVVNQFQQTLEAIPAKYEKPQVVLSRYDGIQATAAYLKYKEWILRERIGRADFETLPQPVKFQLLRLAMNPGRPGTGTMAVGINHWARVARNGELEQLFDFGHRTLHETNDATNLGHVVRRATIHTAQAIHLSETVFAE